MTDTTRERLFNLLPVLYRQRDQAAGEPLRALMAVLESEFVAAETDLGAIYDNWFIETCDRWVIPYLADLVGIQNLNQQKYMFYTQRRGVANTIGYRRRKGTLATLEHALRDATAIHVSVVEFFRRVMITQTMAHPRSHTNLTVDLHDRTALAELNMPFSQISRSADVRAIQTHNQATAHSAPERPGKYNLNNLGIFLWRLFSYPVMRGRPHFVGKDSTNIHALFTCSSLGREIPLFNLPESVDEITQRVGPTHLPIRLTRDLLAADIAAHSSRFQDNSTGTQNENSEYYGPLRSLNVFIPPQGSIPVSKVVSLDLSQWQEPEASSIFTNYQKQGKSIAVDVELGRLVVFREQAGAPPKKIFVNFCYGFSADIGGGPYDRRFSLQSAISAVCIIDVAKGTTIDTLQKAMQRWEDLYTRDDSCLNCTIRILDNGIYGGDLFVRLPPGADLSLIADNGACPAVRLIGNMDILCIQNKTASQAASDHPSEQEVLRPRHIRLNGLLVNGGILIGGKRDNLSTQLTIGRLGVDIEHCTVMDNGIQVILSRESAKALDLNINYSIIGPLKLPETVGSLTVSRCILDHAEGYAISGLDKNEPGAVASLERTTIFGTVYVKGMTALDVIFTDSVKVENRDSGKISFSYVPANSETPERENCQPDHRQDIKPLFSSTRYGDPSYAQLSSDCPSAILAGASDDSEMGVFHNTHRLEAEANMQRVLDEFLPHGLQTGYFYVE